VDMDDSFRLIVVLAILSWCMVILGLVGDALGWWNDTGELLVGLGTLGAIPLTTAGILLGSGRTQVRRIGDTVADSHAILRRQTSVLDSMDRKLTKLDKLDELDLIQLQLDRQTGVLEQQLAVLRHLGERT